MIGKAIALYALWRAWRGRKAYVVREPSLLELQEELNGLRSQRREAEWWSATEPHYVDESDWPLPRYRPYDTAAFREPLLIPWDGSLLPYDPRTQRLIW